jgi:hypothetical protein
MTDWASHFKTSSHQSTFCGCWDGYTAPELRKHKPGCNNPSFPVSPMTNSVDFGSDQSDAVIAYRTLWNDYVLATIRVMDTTSQALLDLSTNPPSGFTSDELSQLGTSYGAERDASLQAWNQFAGASTDTMTAEAQVMTDAFRVVVTDMQRFWKDEKISGFITDVEPPKPSAADQKKVDAQVKKAVAGKSSFSLALESLTGVQVPTLPDAGSAALGFLKDHWVVIGLTVVGVGVGVKVLGLAGKTYVKVLSGGFL